MIEGVGEFVARGHGGLPEAGKVGCDDMKAIGQQRNEVPEHVARTRETMQQQQRRCVLGARFAVEDVEAVNVG
jgi:hypothetical protein